MVVRLPSHDLLAGEAKREGGRAAGRQEWEISEEGLQDGADVDG